MNRENHILQKIIIYVAILFFMVDCKQGTGTRTVDLQKEKQALLAAHQKDRQAHFDTDANLLLENSVDSFISVSNGAISVNNKANRLKFFTDYFKNATYVKWDDMEEPVIRISADGELGWMITHLEVKRLVKDSTGKENEQSFKYAGVTLYKKINGEWLKEANISTFVPLKN